MMDDWKLLVDRMQITRDPAYLHHAGKPVVAYDCDGAREACRDGETGFLVQPGDFATLKKRLLQLAGDPALCRKMGQAGQDFARENFPVEKMVRDIYNLYQKLVSDH